jgi:hypothetical protein
MPSVAPLPEIDHQGYAIADRTTVVVDPPLSTRAVLEATAALPPIVAVVEIELPGWRIGGGRLLAEHLGVPRFVASDRPIDGAEALVPDCVIPGDAGLLTGETEGRITVSTDNADHVFVGSLDRDPDGGPARAALAARFPTSTIAGSAGLHTAAGLAALRPPPPSPLNREAIELTNRGEADMYWADPRFVEPAPAADLGYLERRRASPWAPTIVDLGEGGDERWNGYRVLNISPARLSSCFTELLAERELVVVAPTAELAGQAAGFLLRLGLGSVSWLT